ncbi:cytochrome c biogenesis protein CcdA [Mesorhizobium sp.]|uniref:cytochrome c biogenesis CcdA family protein n=1 Tax=Mesorhizobium sp. TaxID=1871066 RepID=UPI000FE9017D|nr:cytochrome c biogenesis protein CcdA [Mesorhizobium sp.]RWI36106.1 MAG: cytochrome C biogenesis protein [Mesorhizobium sp.]
MIELEPLLQNVTALTPLAVALVALAGLAVGIAPSSFPLISVAAGLAAGQGVATSGNRRIAGLWLSLGFALGIATVDAVLGAMFGLAGFAVLRVLVGYLALAYAMLAVVLAITGLALLRIIHIIIPVVTPSAKPTQSFLGSYLLGLPFGLSTCPACTPLLLPVVAAAATTADPPMGAVLMATFGLARGIPIVVAGTAAGTLGHLRHTYRFTLWVERAGGALLLAAALYFFYQAAVYAGWLSP